METGQIDVSAWPTDFVRPEAMEHKFSLWLHRQAGVVKAVINWSER
jgi:hypothetical protein